MLALPREHSAQVGKLQLADLTSPVGCQSCAPLKARIPLSPPPKGTCGCLFFVVRESNIYSWKGVYLASPCRGSTRAAGDRVSRTPQSPAVTAPLRGEPRASSAAHEDTQKNLTFRRRKGEKTTHFYPFPSCKRRDDVL